MMSDYNYHFWPIAIVAAIALFIIIMVVFLANREINNLKSNRIAPEEGAVLESRMEIQDSTSEFISAELHDNIGQKLALAKLLLTSLPKDLPPQIADQVQSSIDVLGEAMTEVRSLSSGLRNDLFMQYGLLEATRAEIEKLKKTAAYEVEFNIAGEAIFLPENRELVLFRVIQEVLHNIIKHASASKIKITLEYKTGYLFLDIIDNGVGFNTTGYPAGGAGIKNINKRIRLLNGETAVFSEPGNGTHVHINLPFYDRSKKI